MQSFTKERSKLQEYMQCSLFLPRVYNNQAKQIKLKHYTTGYLGIGILLVLNLVYVLR